MTFAGSPDRVESRLVPEAGFELDTFAISGFPRKPSLELVRALARGRRRRSPAGRSSRRRRPDVVLGGGGYVAGPMVLAARLQRDPGGADRGRRASRPREPAGGAVRLEALPRLRRSRGARAPRSRSSAARSRRPPRREPCRGAGALRHRRRRAGGRRLRCLAGATSLNEMAVAAWGDEGPTVLHVSGERDYAPLAARVHRPRLPADAAHGSLRRRSRRCRRGGLACRRHGVGARCGRDAVDPRALSRTRPPTTRRSTRGTSSGGAARSWCRTPRSPRCRSSSRRCSPIPTGSRRCGRRCWPWPAWTRPNGSPRG